MLIASGSGYLKIRLLESFNNSSLYPSAACALHAKDEKKYRFWSRVYAKQGRDNQGET
jgi:hypothetical protein